MRTPSLRHVLWAACLVSKVCLAQESALPTISTERPSVGAGPDLVRPGWMVVENGIGVSRAGGSWAFDGTETMIRYGLNSRLELRLSPTDLDTEIGALHMRREDGGVSIKTPLPSWKAMPVALIVGSTIPVASSGHGSGAWDPTFALTTVHSVSSRLNVGATWNVYWTSSPEAERARSQQWAFDAGFATSATTSTFVEWAPLVSTDASKRGYTADAGWSWTRHGMRQWDVRAGYSRSGTTAGMVGGVGYSLMLPRLGLGWKR